jgi:F-type H+-transporting ATPase subunit c
MRCTCIIEANEFTFNFESFKGEHEMDPSAAKLIGAGLASIALVGAGVGIGTIFGNYLQGALRNPSAAPGQFANLLLGFALAEATGLFGLVVALIILFVF